MAMDVSAFVPRERPLLIVGDLMLDVYLAGHVARISPEAPVPVLRFLRETETAGGAANVALNVTALGGTARLLGVVGADEGAGRLAALMQRAGIMTDFVTADDRPTTTKTRVLAGQHHQLLRIDRETVAPLAPEAEAALIARIEAAAPGAGAVVLSDYGKGCLTDRVIAAAVAVARGAGVPVLVDPKRKDFAAYRGADYIKPNLAELAAATGIDCGTDAGAAAAAAAAMEATGAAILLTRSEKGMTLYAPDGETIAMATEAREVFDVSGAGDTVMATFALMLTGGASRAQAMRLANVAAGIVVSKAGTATASRAELEAALAARAPRQPVAPSPVLGWDEARARCDEWRQKGLRIGFTNGCFDLLHPGHIAILKGAAAACDRLVVGLNSDASVRRLKGPTRPIQAEAARAEVMGAIGVVDAVVIFDQDTPLELITHLMPDVLVKGADYAEDQIVGADVVRRAGGRVERVELVAGHSTTGLVARSRG
jgi:D-beta-D-heptose 7-phosphate kinase/D-beta-D-heptose 1-phosphate adenosyltransferase